MVNCAAPECKNDSRSSVRMNRIPKDRNRQKQWLKNAGLPVKKLNKVLFICEYHFTADMWEKVREDGKRKLKLSAVPTIFGDLVTQIKYDSKTASKAFMPSSSPELAKQIITICNSSSNNIIIKECINGIYHNGYGSLLKSTTQDIVNNIKSENETEAAMSSDDISTGECSQSFFHDDDLNVTIEETDKKMITDDQINASITPDMNLENSDSVQNVKKLEQQIKQLEKQLLQSTNRVTRFKKSQERLENKLKYQIETNKQLKAQLKNASVKQKKSPRWSNNTIIEALQLKFACGTSGYKELIRQKQPLPTLKTLNKRLKDFNFTSGILPTLKRNRR